MGKNWLFLRGFFDKRTEKSIKDDDDVWLQLFDELVGGGNGLIYFNKNNNQQYTFHSMFENNCIVQTEKDYVINPFRKLYNCRAMKYDIIFSRGAFPWQVEILKRYPDAYKIRYSAGKRIIPEPGIKYDLILCDSDKQKHEILQRYPKANVHKMIKPAAKHFKPVECKKVYDVCFIANETQGHFKGVQWVYDTVPKDLKVLHLGNFTGQYHAPDNVTRKHVARIDMPKYISQCKVGIVPYWNQIDSCPRIIPEMLACDLSIIVADELNFWKEKYCKECLCIVSNKKMFWDNVNKSLNLIGADGTHLWRIGEYYHRSYYDQTKKISIPVAAKHIKDLIK